jgi:hypothetical protein
VAEGGVRVGCQAPLVCASLSCSLPHAAATRVCCAVRPVSHDVPTLFLLCYQALLKTPASKLFALVLAPTRELAFGISEQFLALGAGIGLTCSVIVGGVDMVTQAIALSKKPHVVIGTPGRVVDHLENTKGFALRTVKFLVMDEADRMLSMDFEESLDKILQVRGLRCRHQAHTIRHPSHTARHPSPVTRHTPPVTRHTPPVIRHTPPVTHHLSSVTPVTLHPHHCTPCSAPPSPLLCTSPTTSLGSCAAACGGVGSSSSFQCAGRCCASRQPSPRCMPCTHTRVTPSAASLPHGDLPSMWHPHPAPPTSPRPTRPVQHIPRERTTYLFSATMTSKVAKLQRASLHNPVRVEAATKYSTVDTLVQQVRCVVYRNDPAICVCCLAAPARSVPV